MPLIESFGPGTRAYLADESGAWALDANGEWQEIDVQSSGSSGGSASSGSTSGGSSGGSSSGGADLGDIVFINFTEDPNDCDIIRMNITFEEFLAALQSRKTLVGTLYGMLGTLSNTSGEAHFTFVEYYLNDLVYSVSILTFNQETEAWSVSSPQFFAMERRTQA